MIGSPERDNLWEEPLAEEAGISETGQAANGRRAASSNFNDVLRASQVPCSWQRDSILPFGRCQRRMQHPQTIPDFKRARVLADVIA